MRVRIITDSPSDVPPHYVEKYNIGVIPCYINFGQESYLDNGIDIPRDVFYRRALSSPVHPTTSASSPGDAEKMMRDALKDADHVIAIHMSPNYSGIYNSSRVAQQEIGEQYVTLIDSQSMSMGSGFQVISAAEKAAEGAGVPEIVKHVADVRSRSKVWATIATLENLRRSGRVNWLSASLGNIFQIKPIILFSGGKAEQVNRVRTFKNAFNELVKYGHSQAPLERLALLHTHDIAAVQELQDAVKDIAPAETLIIDVSAAMGTHLGQGALGIATVRKS